MPIQSKYDYKPDYAVHPGEILEETLDAKGITKTEFAERCGLSLKTISQIINGKAPVTAESAIQFERVLGISSSIWNNLNANHELFVAKKNEMARLAQGLAWMKNIPVNELIRRGIIEKSNNRIEVLQKVLDFFGVGSIEAWETGYKRFEAAFRQSRSFRSSPGSLLTWLRIGQRLAENMDCAHYGEIEFRKTLNEIRKLTYDDPSVFESQMRKRCADCGVLIIFIEELSSIHISGATQWLSKDKALIMLTLRYKTDDHLWFSFFHEAAHILLHSKKHIFIDETEMKENEQECEADDFARNFLIPPNEYKPFVEQNKFDSNAIIKFSRKLDIAPGIVVGRLQHDKYISYKWHNSLKRRFRLVDSTK
ncbi:MAG: addiction module antidote protein, HigA family [candidate division Zixibacteria bacterium RBG_16_53_22]|nr:MAG: addiction module antidote protein, HigA family [candidate division Zixibacteria bacterium RBG_16_53_22]